MKLVHEAGGTPKIIPMRWAEDKIEDEKERCACCGQALKGKCVYVEVVDGGKNVIAPGSDPDQSDAGYMGFFPVGLTCAKQHFPGFWLHEP